MPTCTRSSLVDGAACFKNFNRSERASILIYFNVLELAEIGGTDYTEEMGGGGQLELDSRCLRDLTDQPYCPPTIYELVINYNNAVASGATPASDPSELAAAIACNKNFPMADKGAQMLYLLCLLGQHATQ